ncbi:MAG: DUF72 domain-containing protein [Methanophagales archaeon ANME-1-THS]|nr:MAG: DUF72 domain-containing protein [Methanophagales archaeon ANME-1-THS]
MPNVKVKVGICGFARSQASIFTNLRLLEVQTTFYKPMKRSTAETWRHRAPQEFEFSIKAWQLITHEPTSPTYRKAGITIAENEVDRYGFFRPTDNVFEAWSVTNELRAALDAKIVVFQSPARFKETDANIKNMREFFRGIEQDRKEITMVWEQRGKWDRETIRSLCEELELVHGVDPFAEAPVTAGSAYFRLHGSPPGKRMYRYTYTDEDLTRLYEHCLNTGGPEVYVLFNNETMYDDALRFMKMVNV